MAITQEQLLDEINARLDERLAVEDPAPYGEGIRVQTDDFGRVLVTQIEGPDFVVTAAEVAA